MAERGKEWVRVRAKAGKGAGMTAGPGGGPGGSRGEGEEQVLLLGSHLQAGEGWASQRAEPSPGVQSPQNT